ncbi:CK1 family protein kinase [Tritrichomonas foetus]|uniref:non-specific serine/threonine protein kinase n=1 Tax=Tritrichomonas foetus TaxID=1144522 RepID=A0A1J4KYX2_9EUKA|nr:CK1 family protein kinase [Tritrichomonas foetus]|eukprot:OHT16072.1 CK1 family protein kinase [Tritrichomonas foetus]
MDKLKPGFRFLNYRLDTCIGKGAFGAVWSATQEGTNQKVAIKYEFPTVSKSIIAEEAEIAKAVSSSGTFPRFYGSGVEQGLSYLIMELLSNSLRIFQENHTSGIVPLDKVGNLGIAMLRAIQNFHNCGFVHRDIKPSNFVFRGAVNGSGDGDLCLIDFGLAKRWRSPDGEVFKARENVGFRGTSRYASVNSHEGSDLGRRDDLWSLFYVLIELCAPPLPWKSQTDKDAVAQIKMRSLDKLCIGLPSQFQEFAEHLQTLRFADEPDYDLLADKLQAVIEGAEAASDFGVCLSEQYSSMALIVAPNSGSIIGSSSAVEGSWSDAPVVAPVKRVPEAREENEGAGGGAGGGGGGGGDRGASGDGGESGGCCLLL